MTDWLPEHKPSKEITGAEWLPDRLERLEELATLEHNWDSYQAEPPTEDAIRQTKTVLYLLAHLNTAPPVLVPLVSGGFQLEWHSAQRSMEVEIGHDGKIEGYFFNRENLDEQEF